MPLLLRIIRKSKWYKHPEVKWLGDDELQADALADIATSNNSLSVWEIADNRTNLDPVIAALAAMRGTTANVDFALLTLTAVQKKSIQITETTGTTFDEQVNTLHRELTELSAAKLLALAQIIQHLPKRERLKEPDVIGLIQAAVDAGRIKRDLLSQSIKNKLRN